MTNTTQIGTYLLVGKRGSGKTHLSKEIITSIKDVPKANRFIVSPTIKLDDTLHSYFYPENRFSEYDDDVLNNVLEVIKDARKKSDEKYYFKKDEDGELVRIKSRIGTKNPNCPSFLLMLDDCIEHLRGGVKPSGVSKLITRHRHYKLNMIITTQYYTAVSPVIRTNIMKFYIFSTNRKEIRKIYEEHGNMKKFEDFEKYFKALTDDKYEHCIINYFYPQKDIFKDNLITEDEYRTVQ